MLFLALFPCASLLRLVELRLTPAYRACTILLRFLRARTLRSRDARPLPLLAVHLGSAVPVRTTALSPATIATHIVVCIVVAHRIARASRSASSTILAAPPVPS